MSAMAIRLYSQPFLREIRYVCKYFFRSILSVRYNVSSPKFQKTLKCSSGIKSPYPQSFAIDVNEYRLPLYINYRFKSKSRKPNRRQLSKLDDDDDESKWTEESLSQEEIFDDRGKDYVTKSASVSSLRLDTILRSGIGISNKEVLLLCDALYDLHSHFQEHKYRFNREVVELRNGIPDILTTMFHYFSKIEKAFYDSRLRLNGEKIKKKSAQVNLGDEIDLILNVNEKNEKFLDVMRVIILSTKTHPEEEKIKVTLQRFKQLTIENYPDKWVPSAITEESD